MCNPLHSGVSIMFEHLAKRFADILTKGDVFELFRLLEQRYGSISRACEKIGIERKTFYHWKNAKQINFETKVKVLKVALEEHLIDTLEFLAGKSKKLTKEILEYLIEVLRREILTEDDRKKLNNLIKRAEEIVNEYSIPIIEYLRHELDGLVEAARNRGYELKIRETSFTEVFGIQEVKTEESHDWQSSATMYQYMTSVKMENLIEGSQMQFQTTGKIGGHLSEFHDKVFQNRR